MVRASDLISAIREGKTDFRLPFEGSVLSVKLSEGEEILPHISLPADLGLVLPSNAIGEYGRLNSLLKRMDRQKTGTIFLEMFSSNSSVFYKITVLEVG